MYSRGGDGVIYRQMLASTIWSDDLPPPLIVQIGVAVAPDSGTSWKV
jgi:hypothetical protein